MADTKLSGLTVATTITDDDITYIVDDPAGTPASKSVAMSTLRNYVGGLYRSSLIDGLTLSNDPTDANNDIGIAIGVATVTDGSNWFVATLASALIKRLDATWTVGTNQGGLDTGSEATSTWYHVWLIQRSDTGVVDVLMSTSATAPTMPASYDRKRRIGAIYNNSSGNIDAFSQDGDTFLWSTRVADVSANNPGTSAVLRTLTVPLGIVVQAMWVGSIVDNSYASATYCVITSPSQTDVAANITTNANFAVSATGLTTFASTASGMTRTNTSSQIRSRLSASDADITLRMQTDGWIDPRGRNA